jgi:hypothetical protein
MTLPALARFKPPPGRVYTTPGAEGREGPSVTNITGFKDKGEGIAGWKLKWAGLEHMQVLEEIVNTLQTEDPETAVKMLLAQYKFKYQRKDSADRIKKGCEKDYAPGTCFTAARVGDIVHDMIENYVKTGKPKLGFDILDETIPAQARANGYDISVSDVYKMVWPWFAQFLAWEKKFRPDYEFAEATFWNSEYGYAGTGDLGVYLPSTGKRYLIDGKTGKRVYPDMGMQLVALNNCQFTVNVADGVEVPWKPADSLAVLHIRPEYTDFVEIRQEMWGELWTTFLANLQNRQLDQMQNLVLGITVRTEAEKTTREAA